MWNKMYLDSANNLKYIQNVPKNLYSKLVKNTFLCYSVVYFKYLINDYITE